MKKILLFTTMALALVVGALSFSFVRVGATSSSYNDFVFEDCYCYGWC